MKPVKVFLDALNETKIRGSSYWYPLAHIKDGIPVAAYNLDMIYKCNEIDRLEKVLKEQNISIVTMLQLNSAEVTKEDIISLLYEKDEDGYDFPWFVETYYYDDSKEWLLYVSHEGTITFAGKELVECATNTISPKHRI